MPTNQQNIKCDRCDEEVPPNEQVLGWPVRCEDGFVCPRCYGSDAFCVCGKVLSVDINIWWCPDCDPYNRNTVSFTVDELADVRSIRHHFPLIDTKDLDSL